jgi:DNA-binding MurR/RpiR family transcriptional regulator
MSSKPMPSKIKIENRRSTIELEQFTLRMRHEFNELSGVLQRIALFVDSHQDQLALMRVQDIAKQANVQPSAVVRFSKHFGFSGYSEMRSIFRTSMSQQISENKNYQMRIRDLMAHSDHPLTALEITQAYISGAISGMQSLQELMTHSKEMEDAVDLLVAAPSIWVIGTNRAFPVASYLAYALQHTDKPIHWIASIGAMGNSELRALDSSDVLVGISFAPYGKDTLAAAETAHQKGAKLIALTDSNLSPLAKLATVSLIIPESSVFDFRSLTNNLVVVQSLFVALAYRLELAVPSQKNKDL